MLAVYTFVFSEVFNARWGGGSESKAEFALVLFSGLIVFNFFAECIARAPNLVLSNPNYVKKVIYPLEVLPIVGILSSFYHFIISLCVWFVGYVLFVGIPHLTVFLLPLVLLPLVLLIMGLSWVLSSLGVFLRDVGQIIGVVITVLMFLSPIFYPASAMPEKAKIFLYFNPLILVIEGTRDVLYWGKVPNMWPLVAYTLLAGVVAWAGFAWFQKTRKGFADVL